MKRYSYTIKGQVQGVGFRPFVYQLAIKYNLIGFVKNNSIGVNIEIEGKSENLDKFHKSFQNLPPLAKISFCKKKEIKPLYKGQFEIIQSDTKFSTSKTVSVPPDIAICKKCKLDIKNQVKYKDYFATNCTNCGPRYSIIQTVPYDRVNTSMNKFIMCDSCKKEYKDPLNRRYHAQPIACKECGPKLELIDNEKWKIDNLYENISSLIKDGKIGAIKGIGGFHIVCDATNNEVVKRLRKEKNRPTKPFAIMCGSLDMVKTIAKVSQKEQDILQSKEAPIVLLKLRIDNVELKISNLINPLIDRIGIVLPYTAFYYLLFEYLDFPIIATSANISGEPIITSKQEIESKLPFIDFIVDYDRDIINSVDDSVVQVVDDDMQLLRLSRGYAPKELQLPFKIEKKILALGANQKSTISLAFDDKIILSPYIADLDGIESIKAFENTIETFRRFYDFEPDIIICDKHSGYESSKIAKQLKIKNENLRIIEVQHHLVHLYSVKSEYNLQKKNYISFIFDGTGLGKDGTLWGGEIFVNESRKYHFKPIKLLGGEKAIKECKRVGLSLLFNRYSLEEALSLELPTIKAFTDVEIKLLYNMWQKNLNSPKSSSVGRVFDAIASLSGICQIQSYEGEAGLLSECKIKNEEVRIENSFYYTIVDGIIDIEFNFFDQDLIGRFYATLVSIIINLSQKENLPIILSGGVFQNKTLLKTIIKECKKQNIKYYYNKTIPINDSGISVGQIWYAIKNSKDIFN